MLPKAFAYIKNRVEEILMLLGIPLVAIAFVFYMSRRPELYPALSPALEFSFPFCGKVLLFLLATTLVLFHAYTFNDWANYKFDIADPNKKDQPLPSRAISLNETLAVSLITFLIGIGIYLLFFPKITMGICLLLLFFCILYSNQVTLLKSIPVVSTLIHLVSGTLFFALGWSLFRELAGESWFAGLFFGLLYASGHLSHETIDYEGDIEAGLRTNAAVFGRTRTFWASITGMLISTVYICLLSGPLAIFPPAVGLVFGPAFLLYLIFAWLAWKGGLSYETLSRFRSRYRKVYSLAGIITFLIFIF